MAGGLCAYAALARVFPAAVLAPALAAVCVGLIRDRCVNRVTSAFLAWFAVVFAGLLGATLAIDGAGPWCDFLAKITEHNEEFHHWRVGFKQLFLGAYQYRKAGTGSFVEWFAAHRVAWWSVQTLVVFICAAASRRLSPDQLLAFGFVPVFFLVAATYYYYIILLVPFLYFASVVETPVKAIAWCYLFAMSAVLYEMYAALGPHLLLFYTASALSLGLCALMLTHGLLRASGRAIRVVRI